MESVGARGQELGMAAILPSAPLEEIAKFVANDGCTDIAGYNSSRQLTLSGRHEDIEKLVLEMKRLGLIRTWKIFGNVSEAFHSRWMEPARQEFSKILSQTKFQKINNGLFVSNGTAEPVDESRISTLLTGQLTSPVHWKQSIDWCLEQDPSLTFVEAGPNRVLRNLVQCDHPSVRFIELA